MIKLDYLTPGSPSAGETLPADTSQSVANYRQAIKNCGATMRLDISWGLDRDEPEWDVWKANAGKAFFWVISCSLLRCETCCRSKMGAPLTTKTCLNAQNIIYKLGVLTPECARYAALGY